MRIIETKVYTYAELSDKAKEKARDWYREISTGDNSFAEFATNDATEVLTALGWANPRIYWSGFSSQGDGACFEGTWRAASMDDARIIALLANRPQHYMDDGKEVRNASNAAVHEYAAHIYACASVGLQYVASTHRDRYLHEHSVSFEEFEWSDTGTAVDATPAQLTAAEERFVEASRAYMRAIYRDLEAAHDDANSDAVVAENIEANEYEFTADGENV